MQLKISQRTVFLNDYEIFMLRDSLMIFTPTKEQQATMFRGPGHGLWSVAKSVYLYEVVAQAGLSIFYTVNNKFKIDELTTDAPIF